MVIVIVVMVFSFSSPYFLTLSNAADLIEAYSVTTILAAGVFVVLVSGGIDISFAAVASVTQYIAAMVATHYGVPAVPAVALACRRRMQWNVVEHGVNSSAFQCVEHHLPVNKGVE